MGRKRSQRSQCETLRFPKKPVKFQIILSKIVAARREADSWGTYSQQGFKKGVSQMFPWEEQGQTEGTDRSFFKKHSYQALTTGFQSGQLLSTEIF